MKNYIFKDKAAQPARQFLGRRKGQDFVQTEAQINWQTSHGSFSRYMDVEDVADFKNCVLQLNIPEINNKAEGLS